MLLLFDLLYHRLISLFKQTIDLHFCGDLLVIFSIIVDHFGMPLKDRAEMNMNKNNQQQQQVYEPNEKGDGYLNNKKRCKYLFSSSIFFSVLLLLQIAVRYYYFSGIELDFTFISLIRVYLSFVCILIQCQCFNYQNANLWLNIKQISCRS